MNLIVLFTLFFVTLAASPQEKSATKKPSSSTDTAVSLGKKTYLVYCAVCHGPDGRGAGPAASALKKPPSDLTTLAKTHDGKFPEEYVAGVVQFGKPYAAHGAGDMPVWGPVFSRRENGNEAAVRRRIRNLCDYLATLQEKES